MLWFVGSKLMVEEIDGLVVGQYSILSMVGMGLVERYDAKFIDILYYRVLLNSKSNCFIFLLNLILFV